MHHQYSHTAFTDTRSSSLALHQVDGAAVRHRWRQAISNPSSCVIAYTCCRLWQPQFTSAGATCCRLWQPQFTSAGAHIAWPVFWGAEWDHCMHWLLEISYLFYHSFNTDILLLYILWMQSVTAMFSTESEAAFWTKRCGYPSLL